MSDSIVEKAVAWLVLVRSEDAKASDFVRYQEWRQASPDHEAACALLTRSLQPLDLLRTRGVSVDVVNKVLNGTRRRSRRRMTAMALGALAMGTGWIGLNQGKEAGMLADARTGVSQRRESVLPAGGSLWLDAQTAVDTLEGGRDLRLYRGRLLAQVSSRPDEPLMVHTPLGKVIAQSGRLMVAWRNDAAGLQVTAFEGAESAVSMAPHAGPAVPVPSGQRLIVVANQAPRSVPAKADDALWTRGLIALDDQPLADLVAALQSYRQGVLRIDPTIADLRISGVFSLDDTELTLRALAQTRLVRVIRRTPYWVTIAAA